MIEVDDSEYQKMIVYVVNLTLMACLRVYFSQVNHHEFHLHFGVTLDDMLTSSGLILTHGSDSLNAQSLTPTLLSPK